MNAHRPKSPPFQAGLGRIRSWFHSARIEDSPRRIPQKTGSFNRRLFLSALLLESSLLALSACRPAVSLPLFRDDPSRLPPPRPMPASRGVLLEKALEYERQMGERHLSPEGLVVYRVREEGPPTLSLADAAIWTGCYVAAEAFRWKVTADPEARQRLMASLNALHLLHQVTGKKGLLARAVRRSTVPAPEERKRWRQGKKGYREYRWMGDVSVDQVDGVFFGYAIAFDLLDEPTVRAEIAASVGAIADHLLDHRMQIIDLDGERTKHGDLGDGFFSEDLNALIALMIMKVAHHITADPRFRTAYHRLISRREYHLRAAAARDKWWEYLFGTNHSDNNLAFLAFYPLMRLEQDPALRRTYRKGLRRAWEVVRVEANPLFTFIHQAALNKKGEAHAMARAGETLFHFPSEKRNRRVDRRRRNECRSLWNDRLGRRQSCRPLPIQNRPADSFEWKENPYRLKGGGDGRTLFAGVDYLLPYWMGRYHQFLNPRQ